MIVTVLCTNTASQYFNHIFTLIDQTNDGLGNNVPKRFICEDIDYAHERVLFLAYELELLDVDTKDHLNAD